MRPGPGSVGIRPGGVRAPMMGGVRPGGIRPGGPARPGAIGGPRGPTMMRPPGAIQQ
jgi:hypothetical protein